jgi:hypothetical protein
MPQGTQPSVLERIRPSSSVPWNGAQDTAAGLITACAHTANKHTRAAPYVLGVPGRNITPP